MKMTGAQVMVEILREHGVDLVFGYPGGTALNFFDALYERRDEIKHVLVSHEQGAAHMADGYSRATGRVGVCCATSGPGATNLVTGIATAFLDSIPMVAITCNVPDSLIGKDAFQEVSITGVTMPISKHNYFVNRIEDLPAAMHNAFRIAQSGRKGPVLVDVTKDVTAATIDYDPSGYKFDLEPYPSANMEDVEQVAEIINKAKRPIVYFGGGVVSSGARQDLIDLVEKADMPAAHTLMATGTIGYSDPRNMGMLGMHGTVAANRAVDKADVLIALGARFSDRVALNPEQFGKKAIKIQVDVDKSEINKNVLVDYGIVSDVKDFLQKLLPLINENKHEEWVSEVTDMQRAIAGDESDGRLHPHQIIHTICEETDPNTIYVTDVGQHQMWAAQFLENNNTSKFITSGGLGTMGFGYGASIGAKLGCPDQRVVHITGDASLHMNMQEAATAVSQELPIITVIMDNEALGMVKQLQTRFAGSRYFAVEPHRKTDFCKIIEGFGGKGFKAETPDAFREAFRAALKEDVPTWIWCKIDGDQQVLPMIPGGGTTADMFTD